MKLQSHSRLVKTNIESETRDFGIDAEDAQGLTILLRDTLYEDKILAPIREYVTNAFDANEDKYPNIVFKQPTPIKIKLPTSDSPQFSVRDYGFGLTESEIFNIFTRYGKSTKRDSNSVTGCFGIGSKSYAAYTDKATIVSRTQIGNNKIDKSTYVMYLDENQQAKIKHVQSVNYECNGTLESNSGLEITWAIQLEDMDTVIEKFTAMYRAWNPNEYRANVFIVKDAEEEKFDIAQKEYTVDTPHYLIEKESSRSSGEKYDYKLGRYVAHDSAVVMGPIQYPLKTETIRKSLNEKQIAFLSIKGLVLKLKLGSVGVTGSREGLSYNSLTIAALSSKINECLKIYEADLKESLSECKTWFEAYTKAQSIRNNIPQELRDELIFEWNGMTLEWNLNVPYELPKDCYAEKLSDITQFHLTKNKNSEIRIKKGTTLQFSINSRTLMFACDLSKTTKHQAARKLKHKILELWNDDCALYAQGEKNNSKWFGQVQKFIAYVIYLNDPVTEQCYVKHNLSNQHKDEKHVLALTELPKWFKGLDYIKVEDIEVPKIERVQVKRENKPNKILAIDFLQSSWRGAISPTPTEYDVNTELCTLVTSNYSPTTRDVKSDEHAKTATAPGIKKLNYKRLKWTGSPKLMQKVLDKIGNPTVMPIRASELKKKSNKNLPSFTELAFNWAINYLKEHKKELSLGTIDLCNEAEKLELHKPLCILLFNKTDANIRYFANYHEYLKVNTFSVDNYKGLKPSRKDNNAKIKDKRLTKLLNDYESKFNEARRVQNNKDFMLAVDILWATNAAYNGHGAIWDYCTDVRSTLKVIRKIFKIKSKNVLQDIRVKTINHMNKKHKILNLISVAHNYYSDRNTLNTIEDLNEYCMETKTETCYASAPILIAIMNKEIK